MKKIIMTLLLAISSLCAAETAGELEDAQIWGLGISLHALVDHCEKMSPKEFERLLTLFTFCMWDSDLTPRQLLKVLSYKVNGQDVISHAKSKYSRSCNRFAKDLIGKMDFCKVMITLRAGDLSIAEIRVNKKLRSHLDKATEFVVANTKHLHQEILPNSLVSRITSFFDAQDE